MEVQMENSELEAEKTKQIVVLLIGPPGSGKSTFCDTVMRSSHRPWSRVCQTDAILTGTDAIEKAAEFLPELGTARLVLVDLSHGSKILSLVKAKASQKNIDSARFFTFVGDITKLRSEGDLHCNAIANAANW